MPAVKISNFGSEKTVGPRAAVLLDPRMLIGGNCLGSKLTADPVVLLRQQDPQAASGCGQGTGNSPDTAADDGYVCP
jgi:hypothetical protein